MKPLDTDQIRSFAAEIRRLNDAISAGDAEFVDEEPAPRPRDHFLASFAAAAGTGTGWLVIIIAGLFLVRLLWLWG
jgi:hypothetical protein